MSVYRTIGPLVYAQNGLQKPQREEHTSSMHFRYRKIELPSYGGGCIGDRGGGGVTCPEVSMI